MSSADAAGDIADFFAGYTDAFNRLDSAAIADFYHAPSAIAQDGVVHVFDSAQAMAANMAKLCAAYRDNGFRAARFTLGQVQPQGSQHAFADLAWQVDLHADLPSWRFGTSYNLIHTAAGWRIVLCTAYQESAAWKAVA